MKMMKIRLITQARYKAILLIVPISIGETKEFVILHIRSLKAWWNLLKVFHKVY